MSNANPSAPDSGRSQVTQFATFYLADHLYGIDVMKVQEVTNPLPMTRIRLAQPYVKGLINLRGQISTAIGLRELLGCEPGNAGTDMAVICRVDGHLISFLVDRVGDVVEVPESAFEPTPDTLPEAARRMMKGVYKTSGPLLSVIDIDLIHEELGRKDRADNDSRRMENL